MQLTNNTEVTAFLRVGGGVVPSPLLLWPIAVLVESSGILPKALIPVPPPKLRPCQAVAVYHHNTNTFTISSNHMASAMAGRSSWTRMTEAWFPVMLPATTDAPACFQPAAATSAPPHRLLLPSSRTRLRRLTCTDDIVVRCLPDWTESLYYSHNLAKQNTKYLLIIFCPKTSNRQNITSQINWTWN